MRSLFCWFFLAAPLAHAQAVLVDRIVATVENRAITRSMVDTRLKQGAKDRAEARDLLIEETLITLDCDKQRITVEPVEVDRALGEIAKTNNLSDEQLLEALKQQGYELQSYRAALRTQLLSMRWLTRQLSGTPLPTEPAERGAYLDLARKRFVETLRSKTAVEVLEVQP